MTVFQVIDVLRQAGFSGVHLVEALAVVLAENPRLDPNATHINSGPDVPPAYQGSVDAGLFQINSVAHPGVNVFDPVANAKAAFGISNGGTDWSQWTTWIKGIAQKNLPHAASLIVNATGHSLVAIPEALVSSAADTAASTIGVQPPTVPRLTFPDLTGALSSIASSASGAASSVGQAVSDAGALIGFLQLPQLYLRLSLGLLGGLLIVVGLVLFAVSFMPRSVSQQLATVAKAAAA